MAAENLGEKLRVQATLGLVGAFILVGGFYGAFDDYLFPALLALLLIVAAVSACFRAWIDAALALGLFISYASGRPVFADLDTSTYLLRTTGLNAFLLLNLVLLIGP